MLFREIDFNYHRGNPDCKARIIWQTLFDVYNDGEGDLRNLHDLLCDYDTIKHHFETPGGFKLYWSFDEDMTYISRDMLGHNNELLIEYDGSRYCKFYWV